MNRIPNHRSGLSLILVLAFAAAGAAPAPGQSRAEELEAAAVFGTAPPTPPAAVQALIDWVGPNGVYDHTAPNFGNPAPPLPADVVHVIVENSAGKFYVSLGGSGYCIVSWTSVNVWLTFSDGSTYGFSWRRDTTICTNGFIGLEDEASDGAWKGGTGGFFRNRSYEHDSQGTWRKRRVMVPAGQTLVLPAQPAPFGGAGWDEVEIIVGPGGTLDLTGHPAAAGPVIVAGSAVLLRCDTILLDPGVTLAALVQPAPVTGPGLLLGTPEIRGRTHFAIPSSGPAFMPLRVGNTGNQAAAITVSWSDNLGWVPPGQTVVTLNPNQDQVLSIPLFIPPGTPPGSLATVSAVAVSSLSPGAPVQQSLVISHAPVGVHPYGQETPGCAGRHDFTATGDARIGNSGFGLVCRGAPPSGLGYFCVTLDPLPVLMNFGIGAPVYLDPLHPSFGLLPIQADAAGQHALPLPLPQDPALIGIEATTQIVWQWPGPCPASGTPFSATSALRIVLQI